VDGELVPDLSPAVGSAAHSSQFFPRVIAMTWSTFRAACSFDRSPCSSHNQLFELTPSVTDRERESSRAELAVATAGFLPRCEPLTCDFAAARAEQDQVRLASVRGVGAGSETFPPRAESLAGLDDRSG
jgi:hypothetical protein